MSTGGRVGRAEYIDVIADILKYTRVGNVVRLGAMMHVSAPTIRKWISDTSGVGISTSQYDRLCFIQMELEKDKSVDDIIAMVWRPKAEAAPPEQVTLLPKKEAGNDLRTAIELMRESLDKLELSLP